MTLDEFFEKVGMQRKDYEDRRKLPPIVQEILQINDKLQSIGKK